MHQHQHQQRKQSQQHSRHTSPHSHHSHSLHTSPHQSHHHVNATISSVGNAETTHSPTRTAHSSHRASIQSSSSHSHHHHHHHHHHHRKRSRRQNSSHHTIGSGSGGGGGDGIDGISRNSSFHGPHGHSHGRAHDRLSTKLKYHSLNCSRRHKSAMDIPSAGSLNTNRVGVAYADREIHEIFVPKTYCSSSRTELAQFFAEDLYGSSRRPSSCCTSSDYCYQTDSTSLYGSRSSLSRNNSVKSASVAMRKRRALHQRQPSYTSISLRGLDTGHPNHKNNRQQIEIGSLKSVFDRDRARARDRQQTRSADSCNKIILSPSKVTIERQTSKDTLGQELPDYACSPSPIRWSFLADEKLESDIDAWKSDEPQQQQQSQSQSQEQQPQQQPTETRLRLRKPMQHQSEHSIHNKATQDEGTVRTCPSIRKFRDSPFSCDLEESSTTVLFHQEGEAFNNCCSNYIQCNSYLDQDLQITSEDIQQYLSKGTQNGGDILNNSKSYPFQPTNALEFQYKNNFANNSNTAGAIAGIGGAANETGTGTTTTTTTADSSEVESVREATRPCESAIVGKSWHTRQSSNKDTNLMHTWGTEPSTSAVCALLPSRTSTPLSSANINLSSSSNNINIIYNTSTAGTTNAERSCNMVKFINTMNRNVAVSTEAHHEGYLSCTQQGYDYTNMSSNSLFDKPLGIDELPKAFETSSTLKLTTVNVETSSSDGQHSSPLPSPVRKGVSFESFDASSDHNLISQRGSCQFSSPTPTRSPLSPISAECSSLTTITTSANPTTTCYVYEKIHQYQQPQPQPHHHHQSHQQQHRNDIETQNCNWDCNCSISQQNQHQYECENQQQQQQRHHHHHHRHRSPTTSSTMEYGHCNYSYDCQHQLQYQHTSESFKLSNAFKKVRKRARKYTNFLRKK